ncbi:MAG TPA: Ldh family oxidoreductase [Geminicoccaceae bacterium]|nr:Ldh family oxidoreductase [Geminicoccaceae bacterium]
MTEVSLRLDEARRLVEAVFLGADTSPDNAASVAAALVLAEADGQKGHGLSRVAAYADQARSGKVDGRAVPEVRRTRPGAIHVDARCGFAYPALDAGVAAAVAAAPEAGAVAVAIGNSHHFGVAGHPVERLARRGLVGLAFGNTPAAIPPWGGVRPLFGTNPIALACPRRDADPLVIDLSLSKVARGRVMLAAQRGEAIPEGWALDADGRPTTDPEAALAGAMLPMGDAKGAALVLMVEILAAALSGSHFGFEAGSFFTAEGPPPRVGQLLLALDPAAFGGGGTFLGRIEALAAAVLAQPGTRLPGRRRFELRHRAERDGLLVPEALYRDLAARAAG